MNKISGCQGLNLALIVFVKPQLADRTPAMGGKIPYHNLCIININHSLLNSIKTFCFISGIQLHTHIVHACTHAHTHTHAKSYKHTQVSASVALLCHMSAFHTEYHTVQQGAIQYCMVSYSFQVTTARFVCLFAWDVSSSVTVAASERCRYQPAYQRYQPWPFFIYHIYDTTYIIWI